MDKELVEYIQNEVNSSPKVNSKTAFFDKNSNSSKLLSEQQISAVANYLKSVDLSKDDPEAEIHFPKNLDISNPTPENIFGIRLKKLILPKELLELVNIPYPKIPFPERPGYPKPIKAIYNSEILTLSEFIVYFDCPELLQTIESKYYLNNSYWDALFGDFHYIQMEVYRNNPDIYPKKTIHFFLENYSLKDILTLGGSPVSVFYNVISRNRDYPTLKKLGQHVTKLGYKLFVPVNQNDNHLLELFYYQYCQNNDRISIDTPGAPHPYFIKGISWDVFYIFGYLSHHQPDVKFNEFLLNHTNWRELFIRNILLVIKENDVKWKSMIYPISKYQMDFLNTIQFPINELLSKNSLFSQYLVSIHYLKNNLSFYINLDKLYKNFQELEPYFLEAKQNIFEYSEQLKDTPIDFVRKHLANEPVLLKFLLKVDGFNLTEKEVILKKL